MTKFGFVSNGVMFRILKTKQKDKLSMSPIQPNHTENTGGTGSGTPESVATSV